LIVELDGVFTGGKKEALAAEKQEFKTWLLRGKRAPVALKRRTEGRKSVHHSIGGREIGRKPTLPSSPEAGDMEEGVRESFRKDGVVPADGDVLQGIKVLPYLRER